MTLICETEGLRLDLFLSQAVPGLSRSAAQNLPGLRLRHLQRGSREEKLPHQVRRRDSGGASRAGAPWM